LFTILLLQWRQTGSLTMHKFPPRTMAISRLSLPRSLQWAGCALIVAGGTLAAPVSAEEKPADIIAAHIRQQGYVCEVAQDAERVPKESKPDEPVWTLRCSNATYRVRLIPDLAAKVETIK
jgi:hypothetical protein